MKYQESGFFISKTLEKNIYIICKEGLKMNYKENPPQEQTEQEESTGCTAAEILVKCLEEEGVEYVFGIQGKRTWT